MAPEAKTAPRSRKPPSDSPQNSEKMSRDKDGSSNPSLSTTRKEQKAGSKKRTMEKEENGYPTPTGKKQVGVGARVFTEEDDIAILQGMIDSSLSIATKELHGFLEGKLSGDFSYSQLYEKIRRLKEKFVKNRERADSLEAHDALLFDLSNQIWGKDKVLVDNGAESNKKKKKEVPRNLPMKVGKDGSRDSEKNKLQEEVVGLIKKYELKIELAKLSYEKMTKG